MFKTKEIKTKTLGEKLKKARESAKIALWQASRKTKIPVNYLKNLEEGNYNELPADVYIGAYLRKYAEILKLDIEELLEQFKIERGVETDLENSPEAAKTSRRLLKKPLLVVTPKRLGLVLAIMAIGLVFGYFWHQMNYLLNPPIIRIAYPVSDFITQEKSIQVAGRTSSEVSLTINGKEVYVDNKGNFSSVVSLDLGLNILKIEAKDRFGKINTVIRKVVVTR